MSTDNVHYYVWIGDAAALQCLMQSHSHNGIIHKHFWDFTSSDSFENYILPTHTHTHICTTTRKQLDLRHQRSPKWTECFECSCILLNELTWIQVKHCCITLSECFVLLEMKSAYHTTTHHLEPLHANPTPSRLKSWTSIPICTAGGCQVYISLRHLVGFFAWAKRMFLLQPAPALLVNFMVKKSQTNSKRLEALSASSHSADCHYTDTRYLHRTANYRACLQVLVLSISV